MILDETRIRITLDTLISQKVSPSRDHVNITKMTSDIDGNPSAGRPSSWSSDRLGYATDTPTGIRGFRGGGRVDAIAGGSPRSVNLSERATDGRNGQRKERCSVSAGPWRTRGSKICWEEDGTTRVLLGSQGRFTGCGGSLPAGSLVGSRAEPPLSRRGPHQGDYSIPRESEREERGASAVERNATVWEDVWGGDNRGGGSVTWRW